MRMSRRGYEFRITCMLNEIVEHGYLDPETHHRLTFFDRDIKIQLDLPRSILLNLQKVLSEQGDEA